MRKKFPIDSWTMVQAIAAGRHRGPYPADFYGPGLVPEPTKADPGSEEKIQVLMRRAAQCQQLHHPDDPKLTSDAIDLTWVVTRRKRPKVRHR